MKKQILNLGKALNKAEQKSINGGVTRPFNGTCLSIVCHPDDNCCDSNGICGKYGYNNVCYAT